MKAFLKSKVGVVSLVAFTIMMGLVLHRIVNRRQERRATARGAAVTAPAPQTPSTAVRGPGALEENAAYLERYYELDRGSRDDHDRHGNRLTRRDTPAAARVDPGQSADTTAAGPGALAPTRTSLRLQGKGAAGNAANSAAEAAQAKLARPVRLPSHTSEEQPVGAPPEQKKARPQRFSPYGRVIKCELVFTIDSTSEQCPLVGVVMEPVYNNGALIIPAGTELHGVARPDRLRDRIFSGQDWVLVFPRETGRLSGRQLNIKGVALDRVEPDANGMTWGITDGSYGLEGRVIRTMNDEEIKRFVATFLAGSSVALQDRNTDRGGQQTVRNTPQNAVLQGLAANFEKIAEDISAEIAQHGVFIRVPGGHQFYFYPMQIIDPDAADISSDVATVK